MVSADPEVQGRAERLRARLYAARAQHEAGRYQAAQTLAREVLDDVSDDRLAAVAAEAHYVLGNAEAGLARPVQAAEHLESAYLSARALGHERLATVTAIRMVNVASRQLLDDALAERWTEWAQASLARSGDDWEARASLSYALAIKAQRAGRLDLAEERYGSALDIFRKHDDVVSISACLSNLAEVRRAQGRPEDALTLIEESLLLRQRALGPTHPSAIRLLGSVGLVRLDLGRLAEARAALEQVLARQRAELGERNADVATALINLSTVECSQGDFEGCLQHNKEAAAILEEQVDADHPFRAAALDNIGYALAHLGRAEEALPYHQLAYSSQQNSLPADHPQFVVTATNWGRALASAGHPELAQERLDEALMRARTAWGEEHVNLGPVHLARGYALERRGRDGRFELRAAVACFRDAAPGYTHATALLALADAELARHGDDKTAEALRVRARAMFERIGNAPGAARADALWPG